MLEAIIIGLEPYIVANQHRAVVESDLVPLVSRVARGDEGALREIYDETRSQVYGLAFSILRDRDDADEATLTVFTRVWRNAGRYDASRGCVTAWILLMTRSVAVDVLRSRKRRREFELPVFDSAASFTADGEANSDALAGSILRAEKVRNALSALPDDQRQALVCAYYLGMSHSEVAEHLDTPLGTIKSRIKTGLSRLRDEIALPRYEGAH